MESLLKIIENSYDAPEYAEMEFFWSCIEKLEDKYYYPLLDLYERYVLKLTEEKKICKDKEDKKRFAQYIEHTTQKHFLKLVLWLKYYNQTDCCFSSDYKKVSFLRESYFSDFYNWRIENTQKAMQRFFKNFKIEKPKDEEILVLDLDKEPKPLKAKKNTTKKPKKQTIKPVIQHSLIA